MKTFCREIKPLVSEYYDTLGRIVTSGCNGAVGKINSTEKFHRLALRFSNKIFKRIGKLLLADAMSNFINQ